MVCLSNICDYPLAQGILESKVKDLGIKVDSTGKTTYHSGSLPDNRSIEVGKKYRVDLNKQKARQFTKLVFEYFTHIFVIDLSNYEKIMA